MNSWYKVNDKTGKKKNEGQVNPVSELTPDDQSPYILVMQRPQQLSN